MVRLKQSWLYCIEFVKQLYLPLLIIAKLATVAKLFIMEACVQFLIPKGQAWIWKFGDRSTYWWCQSLWQTSKMIVVAKLSNIDPIDSQHKLGSNLKTWKFVCVESNNCQWFAVSRYLHFHSLLTQTNEIYTSIDTLIRLVHGVWWMSQAKSLDSTSVKNFIQP